MIPRLSGPRRGGRDEWLRLSLPGMPSDSPFRAVASLPDFPAQELDVLAQWRERRTFARLRAQNAGGPTGRFLDGPITANNPMGVHHAWGRTYKDLYQRYHAMLGHDQRWQNGFDCQGLWVEVNVERELGFTSKRDIEALRHRRVRQPVQAARADLRRAADRAVHPPGHVDGLERPGRAAPPARPAGQPTRAAGRPCRDRDGPVTDSVEMIVGRLGMPDLGGSYFTFSNENNDLIWGFLAECHERGWLYKGHDTMPWCARCGTGHQPDGDERGLPGSRGSRPDRPVAAARSAGRVPAGLDDDALDPDLNVAAAVGAGPRPTSRSPGRETSTGSARARSRPRCAGPFEVLEERPGRDLVGWRYAGPFDELPAVRDAFAAGRPGRTGPYEHRVVAWDEVGEDEGTGIVHIAPGCGAEDFQLGKRSGCRSSRRSTSRASSSRASAALTGRDVRDVDRADHRATSSSKGGSTAWRRITPPLSALLALRHAARLPRWSTSGSSAWARSTTSHGRR